MNIKDAKEQIKNTIITYLTKDELGRYRIPPQKQRPVFLMGPPGIGKTAIMEQVASELNIGLLSYSMTHHTRQSALGLPVIKKKKFGDTEYDISEYTMSEIIGAVYDMMEQTGVKHGILFLDEINCVSETLSPVMLQFLQYKVFGRYEVPEGWVIVTAGNPPEYNHSVREFDIATWDRLKRIDVEPDFDAWKEFAYLSDTHSAIMSYLEIKKQNFYKIETTVDGKSFVTARGWDDLSQVMKLYEQHKLKIDERLISQYIQNKGIAEDFAAYYDLYNKYKSDYQIDTILEGKASDDIKQRAKNAKFDERYSLISLLLDAAMAKMKKCVLTNNFLKSVQSELKSFKKSLAGGMNAENVLDKIIDKKTTEYNNGIKSKSLSDSQQIELTRIINTFKDYSKLVKMNSNEDPFRLIETNFKERVEKYKAALKKANTSASNIFIFGEEVFKSGNELVIMTTELSTNPYSSIFLSRNPCREYNLLSQKLRIHNIHDNLITMVENIGIDDN